MIEGSRQRGAVTMHRRSALPCIALLAWAAIAAAAEPPAMLSDEGACPFECCVYREWSVEADTTLHAEPKEGSPVVAQAGKGTRARGLTGVVITTEPGRFEVLRAVKGAGGHSYEPGEIVWVYTYRGEGFFKVWHRGEFVEEEALFMLSGSVPRGYDWGHALAQPKSTWWVKVRTADGKEGWSDQTRNFGNKDACG